jgi:hypothetical protein
VSPLAVSGIAFACILGSALVAMFCKRALPEHHLGADSKDVLKLGMGVIATLAALVLGLLIATTKGNYDAQGATVKELAAKIILLDRALSKYGSETKPLRELLQSMVTATLDRIWPQDRSQSANLTPGEARAAGEALYDKIAELSPQNDAQRALKARALDLIADVAQTRLRMFAQQDSSLPTPFLVVLVFWLSILFAGYGLLAPPNATVLAVLLVCSLSLSGAIFLMLELATPFAGIMRVSSGPLRDALSLIGQ